MECLSRDNRYCFRYREGLPSLIRRKKRYFEKKVSTDYDGSCDVLEGTVSRKFHARNGAQNLGEGMKSLPVPSCN
jgi:hypothetical protein